MTLLDFLRSGVRFSRVRVVQNGITLNPLRAQGPRDDGLVVALREAVKGRVGLNRRSVPLGHCDTCGDELWVVRDGALTVDAYGSGSCPLCLIAMEQKVMVSK